MGEKLAQQYRDADVFAFPSRQETFGQTKIEALACGTPVIVFDETACAEGIKQLVNGYIAEKDNIEDYANGIRLLFAGKQAGASLTFNPINVSAHNKKIVEGLIGVKNMITYRPRDIRIGWWNTSGSPYGGGTGEPFSCMKSQLIKMLSEDDCVFLGEFSDIKLLTDLCCEYSVMHPDRVFGTLNMVDSAGRCHH